MKTIKNIELKQIIMVSLGSLLSAFAITNFVRIGNLIPSGMSGTSQIIILEAKRLMNVDLPFGIIYFLLNLFLLSLVFKKLGRKFLTLSFMHVILTSILVSIIPSFNITHDKFLIPIFGGILNGLGSTLALRANGSAGGTDFIAIYYSIVKNKPQWDKIMFFNGALLIYSGWTYNWDLAFYSIIYQVISTKIIENYHDRYKLSSFNIVTEMPDAVCTAILKSTRHGITKTDGVGFYHNRPKTILYMVANAFETQKIIDAITLIDPDAFIEISSVDRIEGNYRQKPLE